MPTTPKQTADGRTGIFTQKKKKILTQTIGKPEIEFISYSPEIFLKLLQLFAGSRKNYDGIRVYFAAYKRDDVNDPEGSAHIPAGKEENLTLIFVPTFDQGLGHKDDLTNCCIIENNKIVSVDVTVTTDPKTFFISNWIRHYQHFRIPNLENDGVNNEHITDFKETKSIWYDILLIAPNQFHTGLIDFINCLLGDPNPLDAVNIIFAAHLPDEGFAYQLTLIFNFHRAGLHVSKNNKYFSLAAIDLPVQAVRVFALEEEKEVREVFPFDGDSTDTGNPCPPNTCIGGDLPL